MSRLRTENRQGLKGARGAAYYNVNGRTVCDGRLGLTMNIWSTRLLLSSSNSYLNISYILVFALLVLSSHSAGGEAPRMEASSPFFGRGLVHEIKISLTTDSLLHLSQEPRQPVLGTFEESGKIYRNVSFHLKGHSSYQAIDAKPIFVVQLTRLSTPRLFYGRRKFVLHNSAGDPSYLRDMITQDLFRTQGAFAVNTAHTRVTLNRKDLGLYVAREEFYDGCVLGNANSMSGTLYKPATNREEIDGHFRLHWAPDVNASHLEVLRRSLREQDVRKRFDKLRRILNVSNFLSYMCVEILSGNWDGYWMNNNNYSLYFNDKDQLFYFLPQCADTSFQFPDMGCFPPARGEVVGAILASPEGLALYKMKLDELLSDQVTVDRSLVTIDTASILLGDALIKSPIEKEEFVRAAGSFRRRLLHRVYSLKQQLANASFIPYRENPHDLGWRAVRDVGSGRLLVESTVGRTVLTIGHAAEWSISSWTTGIFLDSGRYKVSADVRSADIGQGSRDSRFTLRVSPIPAAFRIGNQPVWNQCSGEIVVPEEEVLPSLVEVTFELRGRSGQVWIDSQSVRVRRTPLVAK